MVISEYPKLQQELPFSKQVNKSEDKTINIPNHAVATDAIEVEIVNTTLCLSNISYSPIKSHQNKRKKLHFHYYICLFTQKNNFNPKPIKTIKYPSKNHKKKNSKRRKKTVPLLNKKCPEQQTMNQKLFFSTEALLDD